MKENSWLSWVRDKKELTESLTCKTLMPHAGLIVSSSLISTFITHTSLCSTISKEHWCSVMRPVSTTFLKAPVEAYYWLPNGSYIAHHKVVYLALFKYFLSMSRLKASSVAVASRALFLSAINSFSLGNLESHKNNRYGLFIQLLELSTILKQMILCLKQGKAYTYSHLSCCIHSVETHRTFPCSIVQQTQKKKSG